MKRVTLDGKSYVKASVLARELGYTTDYVGQLCRAGKVDAQLVGRSWFVVEDSLRSHKMNRYRSSKAKSQKAVKEHIKERGTGEGSGASSHFYQHRGVGRSVSISYDTDNSDLLPQLRKGGTSSRKQLPVELADAKEMTIRSQSLKYHFQSPKKPKIKFHGTLVVKDVQDEVLDEQEGFDISHPEGDSVDIARDIEMQVLPATQTPKVSHRQKKEVLQNHSGVVGMRRKVFAVSNSESAIVRTGSVDSQTEVVETTSGRLLVLISALVAMVVAFITIGLEAQVQASDGLFIVDYVLVVRKIFALIFVAL